MDQLGAAHRFNQLSSEEQKRYRETARQMTTLARDYAVPIIFAPPRSIGGAVNGATGCILQLGTAAYLVTASHVLAGFEQPVQEGEILNWQIGNLPLLDPIARIAKRSSENDIVLLRLSSEEVAEIGPCFRSVPGRWPPPAPREGQLVLVAGYPRVLREVDLSGNMIGAGPYSALFKVSNTGPGYFYCQIEQRNLVSFDGRPLPAPDTDFGGLSGGPALLDGLLSYPLVGVITEVCPMTSADLVILRVATLDNVI
jgi:hypothetical protein